MKTTLFEKAIKNFVEYTTNNLHDLENIFANSPDQFAYGEKTAYVECLELLKRLLENPELFGLDYDIEKKFKL